MQLSCLGDLSLFLFGYRRFVPFRTGTIRVSAILHSTSEALVKATMVGVIHVFLPLLDFLLLLALEVLLVLIDLLFELLVFAESSRQLFKVFVLLFATFK